MKLLKSVQATGRLLLVSAAAMFATSAQANDYPNRNITLVVPFNPGGATDLVGRSVAELLTEELGQPVVVENRAGAGSQVGLSYVANSRPDGYTLVIGATDGLAIIPAVREKLAYDPIESFDPIGLIGRAVFTYTVRGDFPASSLDEFISYAKDNPQDVTFGTSGVGGTAHLFTEMLTNSTGIEMTHVPYTGTGPVIADMLGGNIDLASATVSAVRQYVEAGTLKTFAVLGEERHPFLPDVPTTTELGYPEIQAAPWFGVFAAAGTPPEVLETLQTALNNISSDPVRLASKLGKVGIQVEQGDAESLKELIKSDIDRFKKLANETGIKLID